MAEAKKLTKGMYNCTTSDGSEAVYHSSTINAVMGTKKEMKVGKKIKVYIPKGAFGSEKSEDVK